MSETALGALYKGLSNLLNNANSLWEDRVYPDSVPAEVERPYVIYAYVGGGELNETKHADARFTIAVKCVADNGSDSMAGAALISALLNDKGELETSSGGLSGGVEWYVNHVTQDRAIHLQEKWQGVQDVYHDGHQFIVRMESK